MHQHRPLKRSDVRSYAAQVGLAPACAACVFAGCTAGPDTGAPAPANTPPAITAFDAACDEADATWSFNLETDGWTGNGRVTLSTDGDYVEKHVIYSVESAADGAWDRLSLDLTVVPDWRDVTLGASTAFNCSAPALTGLVQVWTRDGSATGDCITFGDTPERWAEWAAPGCDDVWMPEVE